MSQNKDLSHTTVLVVDDQPAARRALRRVVERAGGTVHEAGDGYAAMEIMGRESVDVVLSDISMPSMDGLELLTRLRRESEILPVILVTGEPSLDTAIRAIELGAFRYILKPADATTVVEAVQRAAHLHEFARLKAQALQLAGMSAPMPGDRFSLHTRLMSALDGLKMAYHPIVKADQSGVLGYEALLRVPREFFEGPLEVVRAAELLSLEHELGRRVRARIAEDSMDPGVTVFVNLHPRDLLDARLVDGDEALAQMAQRTVLEITERAGLHELSGVRQIVNRLKDRGYRIAVDDLGAGYSGLNSFMTLQPDFVKLDMVLVRGIDTDTMRQDLVRSLLAVCERLDVAVVAEGVETPQERDTLIDLGCPLLQGWLFTKPGPPFPEVSWPGEAEKA